MKTAELLGTTRWTEGFQQLPEENHPRWRFDIAFGISLLLNADILTTFHTRKIWRNVK